jgi:hypothetical protein
MSGTKKGSMIVTELHRHIWGTSNFDVTWMITRPSVYGGRRHYYYSDEAVKRIIAEWRGPVRFRLRKDKI